MQLIKGPVLIYRDPIIHIDDIQEAKAIGQDELKDRIGQSDRSDDKDQINALFAMKNVIFFSQKDNPPLTNRLSGGDLDEDRFEVLIKECGFFRDDYKT